MFRHYYVILRELVVSTLLSYTSISVQLLVIQCKDFYMFYAVETQCLKSLSIKMVLFIIKWLTFKTLLVT